jgi:hypothetical protein
MFEPVCRVGARRPTGLAAVARTGRFGCRVPYELNGMRLLRSIVLSLRLRVPVRQTERDNDAGALPTVAVRIGS